MPEASGALLVWESEGGHLRARDGWTPAGPPATVMVPVYPTRVVAGVVEVAMPAHPDSRDTP